MIPNSKNSMINSVNMKYIRKKNLHTYSTDFLFGAGDRNRTGTISLSQDFKSCASTYSATSAYCGGTTQI